MYCKYVGVKSDCTVGTICIFFLSRRVRARMPSLPHKCDNSGSSFLLLSPLSSGHCRVGERREEKAMQKNKRTRTLHTVQYLLNTCTDVQNVDRKNIR